ncbi:MAG: hypothetical protein IKO68_05075 [Oscillospiraceae bacterium]|nr:hypothetical protein [Oscillospiraceae bacterium]
MRINEYNSPEEFISEYTGVWNPSEGHWLGLDFKYNDTIYRMQTGPMYKQKNTILSDGREAMYGIYKQLDTTKNNDYDLLGEYADMHDMLESTVIGGREFRDIIMDDSTEILGKD